MREEHLLTGELEPTNEPYAVAKMVRTQIQLPEEQVALLKQWAAQHHTSMAEMIRQHEEIVPVLQIQWVDKAVHQAAIGTLLGVARKRLSLVDCVSFETMRLLGIAAAFTLDKHFKEQGFRCLP